MSKTSRARLVMLGVATAVALIGCATVQPDSAGAWRVAPLFRVTHGSDPANSRAYYALGLAQQGEGRWQESAETLSKAVFNDPENAEAFHALGVSQAVLMRYESAVSAFGRAVELTPDSAQYLNNLGYALLLSGKYEGALSYLRAALARDPGHELARANMARAQVLMASPVAAVAPTGATGEPAEAAAVASAAVTAPPPLPTLAMTQVLVTTTVPSFNVARPNPDEIVTDSEAAAAPAADILAGDAAVGKARMAATSSRPDLAAAIKPSERLSGFKVEISNGNGVRGAAARLREWLRERGLLSARLTNQKPFSITSTVVQYQPGYMPQALELANRMPEGVGVEPARRVSGQAAVRVVIGHDATLASACRPPLPCTSDAGVRQAALSGSGATSR